MEEDDAANTGKVPQSAESISEELIVNDFRDDLRAANRMKSYLIAVGVELPEKTTSTLAKLTIEYLASEADK